MTSSLQRWRRALHESLPWLRARVPMHCMQLVPVLVRLICLKLRPGGDEDVGGDVVAEQTQQFLECPECNSTLNTQFSQTVLLKKCQT